MWEKNACLSDRTSSILLSSAYLKEMLRAEGCRGRSVSGNAAAAQRLLETLCVRARQGSANERSGPWGELAVPQNTGAEIFLLGALLQWMPLT